MDGYADHIYLQGYYWIPLGLASLEFLSNLIWHFPETQSFFKHFVNISCNCNSSVNDWNLAHHTKYGGVALLETKMSELYLIKTYLQG